MYHRDDLNFIWKFLPDHLKRKEGDYMVEVVREGKRTFVPLRGVSTAEFCILRAMAKAQESNRKQILRRQLARK
jgi:hypothetical protein